MPLCSICKGIPFQRILSGDLSLLQDVKQDCYETRSRDSISQLISSGKSCDLCRIIADALQSSYWYGNMKTEEDESRHVWLCMPVGNWSPAIWIYLGEDNPDTKIWGKDVKIFADIGSRIAGEFSARYVHASPLHESALHQMDLWLDECNGKHERCSQAANQQASLPTRLLDLDDLPARESMVESDDWHRLFEPSMLKLTEQCSERTGQYVALSYCWGQTLAYQTTKANRETHLAGILFARLPKSLQDAILVTRYMNIRYIWIDCLCIVQDDNEDWRREAANMADIYSKAYLTIAASRASNSAEGFLGARKIKQMDLVQFQDDQGEFQLYFYPIDVNFAPGAPETASLEPMSEEPLTKRAWCLQERLLPMRTLHYGTKQMHWECGQISISEEGEPFGSGNEDFRLDTIVRYLQSSGHYFERRNWYQLVSAYTSRDITQLSDRLPALSGVISAIDRRTGDQCYAGIWKKHFFEGLLWHLGDPHMDVQVTPIKKPMRLGFWRAPSWSWAAVEGTVVYMDYYNFGTDWCAQLEECVFDPDGMNFSGRSPSGYVKINAPIARVNSVGQQKAADGYDCFVCMRNEELVKAKVRFDFERLESCEALMLAPYTGLAISPVDGGDDEYIRVSAIQIWKDPGNARLKALQHCEPKTVKLF